jgi:hypothetical protein
MKKNGILRRRFLRTSAILAMIPVVAASGGATAATNASLRASLKYQPKPEGDKSCASCAQFVPAAAARDPGSCKIIPGDTEISPQGYCIAWTKKA